MPTLRLMTYNVHRCIGRGGQDSTARVREVIADAGPDVVALQELDAPADANGEGVHHAREIASPLGMGVLFCRTFVRGEGLYGHALLSRHALELRRSAELPFRPGRLTEPRGVLWATVRGDGFTLQVMSTHLGLRRFERALHAEALVGPELCAHPEFTGPRVLCGDLNAVPSARTYRRIAQRLRDAQRAVPGHRPRATFPSRFPLLRLDHVFVSDEIRVRGAHVPRTEAARAASDHLPLVVDLELP